MAASEFVDETADSTELSVSRQVMVVAIMALMIVALGAVALKGGSGRADTSSPAQTGASAGGAVATGPAVAVPSVLGMSQADATRVLARAGFKTTISVSRADDHVPVGKIANQLPKAGAKAAKGSTVELALSLGAEETAVPRLIGYPADGALTLLQRAGLGYTASTEISDKPAGTVLRQSPAPGAKRPRGTKVALIVSSGASWLQPGDTVPGFPPDTSATTPGQVVTYWVTPAAPVAAGGGGTTANPQAPTMGGGSGSPTTRPPTTRPPTTRPPTTHPPTTRPPTTRPPSTRPPVTQAPPTTCVMRTPPAGGNPYQVCY